MKMHPGRTPPETYYRRTLMRPETYLTARYFPWNSCPVVKTLVEEEDPRVIRIHIDNHTNQTNTKTKTDFSRADVRDDPDWKLAYQKNGESWAWDSQSFYWLPKASSGFLMRELYSQLMRRKVTSKLTRIAATKR